MFVIETKKLDKEYRAAHALRGVDLSLQPGHIYGLVGNNGAGKTTLFRILAGLARPTSGTFSLFGETTEKGLNQARKRIGFLIEAPVFYPAMTAQANLRNVQLLLGKGSKEDIPPLLERVGLPPRSKQQLHSYSTGMKQRYGLAAALIGDPELMILDEPLNGLDPEGTREINALLQEFRAAGKTILLSSHLLAELYKVATDYIFMDHGRIIQQVNHPALQDLCDFRMTVRTDRPQEAAEILRSRLPDIDEIELGEGCLILPHCTQTAGSIQMHLRENAIESKVETSGITLEDYFLHLVETQR